MGTEQCSRQPAKTTQRPGACDHAIEIFHLEVFGIRDVMICQRAFVGKLRDAPLRHCPTIFRPLEQPSTRPAYSAATTLWRNSLGSGDSLTAHGNTEIALRARRLTGVCGRRSPANTSQYRFRRVAPAPPPWHCRSTLKQTRIDYVPRGARAKIA